MDMGCRAWEPNGIEARHIWMMKTVRLLVPLAVCAAIAAGCGVSKASVRSSLNVSERQSVPAAPTAATTTPSTTDFGVTADYVGAITHDYSDPETGMSLIVPPADATPTVTWQQAVAVCFSGAGMCDRAAGTIRVSMAVGYSPQSGEALPDGSIKPAMNHDLVYVIAQPLGRCAPAGPPGTGTPPSTYRSCTALSFINADTGKAATSVSGPSVRDPSTA